MLVVSPSKNRDVSSHPEKRYSGWRLLEHLSIGNAAACTWSLHSENRVACVALQHPVVVTVGTGFLRGRGTTSSAMAAPAGTLVSFAKA